MRCEVDAAWARRLQTPRLSAKWQPMHPSQADAHEIPIRNTQPAASKRPADRSEFSLVLMLLLIHRCLRKPTWPLPAARGIGSPVACAIHAQPADHEAARRHHPGLAPFHAPPPPLLPSS